jgi:hypothetical protein
LFPEQENQTNQRSQMNQIPAMRRDMVSVFLPWRSSVNMHACGELIGGDAGELHKEAAYGFGWVGGAGPDSFLAQFVAVTQSPNS